MGRRRPAKNRPSQTKGFTWWERVQLSEFAGLRFGTWMAFFVFFTPIVALLYFFADFNASPPKEYTIEAEVVRLWSRHSAGEHSLDVYYYVSFEANNEISRCRVPRFYVDQWQAAREGKLHEIDFTRSDLGCFVSKLMLLPEDRQARESPFAE